MGPAPSLPRWRICSHAGSRCGAPLTHLPQIHGGSPTLVDAEGATGFLDAPGRSISFTVRHDPQAVAEFLNHVLEYLRGTREFIVTGTALGLDLAEVETMIQRPAEKALDTLRTLAGNGDIPAPLRPSVDQVMEILDLLASIGSSRQIIDSAVESLGRALTKAEIAGLIRRQ